MGDVNFAALANAITGRRCPAEPDGGEWPLPYLTGPSTRPYPKITYPRPLSERAAFLHTEWDKWPAGVPWCPRVAIKDGVFPYKVFLTGDYPTGTTWAWYIEDHVDGSSTRYLQFYNANPPSGTFSYRITARGNDFLSTSVDVTTTFWNPADSNIRDQFRIIDGGAGGGGDGAPATPYNNWADMIGATYSDSSVLVILKGSLTVNSATTLALGGTKPKQIIARDDATWTFNLAGIADKFTVVAADGTDFMLKGFAITGQAAAGANQSQIGQANTRSRTSIHDIAFSDLSTSGSNNHGCFGGDGEVSRSYLSILGCSADNVGAGGTNCEIITFQQTDGLIDEFVSTNPDTGSVSFAAIHWKHDNVECETRRVTALTPEGYGYGPIHYGSGGSSGVETYNISSGCVRFCNLASSFNASFDGCIRIGPDTADTQTMSIIRNSLNGQIARNSDMQDGTNAGTYMWYDGNLCQNADSNNGIGAVTNEDPTPGRSAVLGDNYGASSSVLDSNGDPVNPAHIGRYGHRLF